MDTPRGMLLYGYDEPSAAVIKTHMDEITGEDVLMVSASGQEGEKVRRILEKGPTTIFENKDEKVLMFINFDDSQTGAALKAFPKDERIPRPIFCGLTEHNIDWDLKDLIQHLLDEQRHFSQKRGKKP